MTQLDISYVTVSYYSAKLSLVVTVYLIIRLFDCDQYKQQKRCGRMSENSWLLIFVGTWR